MTRTKWITRPGMPMTLGALLALTAAAPALALEPAAHPQVKEQKGKEQKKEETKIESAELGKPAPGFELKNLDGKAVKLSDYKGKTVVLEWFNPACPFCKYAYGEGGPLRSYPEEVRAKGVVWLSIVSENPENPGGKAEAIQKFVEENGMKAPMLLDPDGKIGKAYGAKSTPHVFIISEKGALVYRGALDNAPFGKIAKDDTKVNYVEAAIADLTSGHAVTKAETKSYG